MHDIKTSTKCQLHSITSICHKMRSNVDRIHVVSKQKCSMKAKFHFHWKINVADRHFLLAECASIKEFWKSINRAYVIELWEKVSGIIFLNHDVYVAGMHSNRNTIWSSCTSFSTLTFTYKHSNGLMSDKRPLAYESRPTEKACYNGAR